MFRGKCTVQATRGENVYLFGAENKWDATILINALIDAGYVAINIYDGNRGITTLPLGTVIYLKNLE